MKKGALGIVWFILVSSIFSGCNNSKSLQELLQEEQKATDRFINENGFYVPKGGYPANGVFEEKEYYRTTEGLFFHVVDSGNGNRVQILNDVSVRYDYCQSIKDAASGDTTKYYFPYSPSFLSSGYLNISSGQPYSFVYGVTQTYSGTYSPVCQAWVLPLSYIGENAVVDMIVPSSLGSYYDNMNVTPVFYKSLRYTRFN